MNIEELPFECLNVNITNDYVELFTKYISFLFLFF